MYKYIVMSFVALVACNAYGNFDFTNYTPTLGTDSAYTITFTQVANNSAPNTITTYSVDTNDYSITPVYYTYSVVHGGATNNRLIVNSSTPQNIDESFILQTSNLGDAGAINNSGFNVNSITGDFISNSMESALTAGAINNQSNATTSFITGDFIDNHATYGGAIRNSHKANIGSITGNFIGNYSTTFGGAIVNYDSQIDSVSGNFIGNYGTSSVVGGGAINNSGGGTINHITGDFIGNYTANRGGAIYNYDAIGDITGNFIGNTATNSAGAIWNKGSIESITGSFIGNSATGYAGTIYNNGTIESITGDFIGNSATNDAGAIYNDWIIGSISGNFIGNYTIETNGGAIYTSESIKFLSETDNYVISGNYAGDKDIAITVGDDYDVSKDIFITFENNNSTHYIVNDEIRNDITVDSPYSITVTGDGTGYTQFNNDLHNVNTVNINNGTMIFGQTPDNYARTADVGHFVGATNPIINLENGTFNIANGYTETITLTGLNSVGNNNFIALDLDIANDSADFINVADGISGQINLVVQSLSDLDIGDDIIWFADVNTDDADLFNLYSVSGLDYELGLYFDEDNHKYGLLRLGNVPVKTLSAAVLQKVNHGAVAVTHTVKKLTGSMHKRVGELQWGLKDTEQRPGLNNAFWTRNVYRNFDIGDGSMVLSGIEFGYDRVVLSSNNYKLYIGGLGYVSGGNSEMKDNKLDIGGYGLGAYIMLLGKSGWFGDLVFRQHFIDMDSLSEKNNYTASTLDIEVGKDFVFGGDTDKLNWFIKPSIGGTFIAIQDAKIDSFEINGSTSAMGAMSVMTGPRWNLENGGKSQIYGKVGYLLDAADDVDVMVSGVSTKQDVATNTLEIGGGFNYSGIGDSTNIYLEALYITGSEYSEVSGNFGFRYAF